MRQTLVKAAITACKGSLANQAQSADRSHPVMDISLLCEGSNRMNKKVVAVLCAIVAVALGCLVVFNVI